MNFDWRKYQKVAKKLAQNDDEANLRSAISRSYYAAFGYCKEMVEINNLASKEQIKELNKKNAHVHKNLSNIFKCNDYNLKEESQFISNHLDKSRTVRNMVDYDSEYNLFFLEKDVKRIINDTDLVFEYLNKLKLENT